MVAPHSPTSSPPASAVSGQRRRLWAHPIWGVSLAVAAGVLVGCQSPSNAPPEPAEPALAPVAPAQAQPTPSLPTAPLYFISPITVPVQVTDLIRSRDWANLTRFYNLTLTGAPRDELLSGRYFIDESKSASMMPGALERYRPFPPGSRFVEVKADGDPNQLPCIWTLTTVYEIDQGGGMVQRVMQNTKLIQTSEGYQLLPPAPIDDGAGRRWDGVSRPVHSPTPPPPPPPPPPAAAAAPEFPPAPVASEQEWGARGSDAALFYCPELKARAEAQVPARGMRSVPALYVFVEKMKPMLAAAKGSSRTGSMPWEPAVIYTPSDEELLVSLAGERVFHTVSIAPPGALEEMRRANPSFYPASLTYPHIEIQRVDVAGSGPRYYALPPVDRTVQLGRPAAEPEK